jgi:hypothetical protein
MHNIYISNEYYIVSTTVCFDASASSSGSFLFAKVTKSVTVIIDTIHDVS